MLLLSFVVIPSTWFVRKCAPADQVLIGMGYGATLHNADCQIVVFGDSAAMVGIDPGQVQQTTGLTTCSIGENEGLIVLNGNKVLDRYMAQNRPPRYLVFLFSPEDFNPSSPLMPRRVFEGTTWRMGQPDKLAGIWNVLHRPDEIFQWASAGWRLLGSRALKRPLPVEALHARERTKGQLTLRDRPMKTCTEPPLDIPPDKAWIASLRSRYAREGETVLVDAMPVPECDPSQTFYKQRLAKLVDNPMTTLPASVYLSGGRHVDAAGSTLLSRLLSAQILGLEHGSAKRPTEARLLNNPQTPAAGFMAP